MTHIKQMGHLWLAGTSLAAMMLVAACGQSAKSNNSAKQAAPDPAIVGSSNAVCASPGNATTANTGGTAASGRAALAGTRSSLGPSSLDLADAAVSYSGNIQALLKTSCLGCHSAGAVQPDLSNAASVTANQADIVATVTGATMPPPPASMTAANKALFQSWEDGGFQMASGAAAPASPGILGSGTGGAAASTTAKSAGGSAATASTTPSASSACPGTLPPVTSPSVTGPAPVTPSATVGNTSGSMAAPASTIPNPLTGMGGGTGGFDISSILAQLAGGGTAGLSPDVLKQITDLIGQAGAAVPKK